MKNKSKKILLGVGTLGAAIAPITAVIACGTNDAYVPLAKVEGLSTMTEAQLKTAIKALPADYKELKIALGVPKAEYAANEYIDQMNKEMAAMMTAAGIDLKVTFAINAQSSSVPASIPQVFEGAFLPSGIMGSNGNKLNLGFLAARPSLKYGTKQDDNSAIEGKDLTALITSMNALLSNPTNYTSKDIAYNSAKPSDFYRSEIYTDSASAVAIWNDKTKANAQGLKEFTDLGLLVKHTESESGYIVPQRMIAKHFNSPDFKISSVAKKSSGVGVDKIGENDRHIYFSYAGEILQKGAAKAKEFLNVHSNFRAVALSDAIPNDGFSVSKDMPKEVANVLFNIFKKYIKTKNSWAKYSHGDSNMLTNIFYHMDYKLPSDATIALIHKQSE